MAAHVPQSRNPPSASLRTEWVTRYKVSVPKILSATRQSINEQTNKTQGIGVQGGQWGPAQGSQEQLSFFNCYLFIYFGHMDSMCDLISWTRDQTLSLALEGGFLTTGPPGKSPFSFLKGFFFFQPVLRCSSIISVLHYFCWELSCNLNGCSLCILCALNVTKIFSLFLLFSINSAMMCIGVVLLEFILIGFAELLNLNCFPPNLRKFQSIFFFF